MPALIAWLLSTFGTLIGYSVLRFAAWKILLWTMAITIFPVLIMRAIYMLIEAIQQTIINTVADPAVALDPNALIISMSGLAAWLAIHLRVVDGFSILMSAVIFRLALRMIPFVRL